MENKDKLNSATQMFSTIAFLFVSSCAGFGFTINLPEYQSGIILQILSVLIGIFVILCLFWGFNTLFEIQKLKITKHDYRIHYGFLNWSGSSIQYYKRSFTLYYQ